MAELQTNYIRDIGRAPGIARRNALVNERLEQQSVMGQREIDRFRFKDEKEATDYFMQVRDMITIEDWPQFKQYSIARGVPKSMLPDFGPEDAEKLEDWKLTTAQKINRAEAKKLKADAVKIGTMQTIFGTDKASGRSYEQKQRKQKDETWKNIGGRKYVKKTGAGAGGYKSSDSNTIGRTVGNLFGGMFDPITGTFGGLDKKTAKRATKIRARAERLFVDANGELTHAEAVEKAAAEYGVEFPKKTKTKGWRNYLPGGKVEMPSTLKSAHSRSPTTKLTPKTIPAEKDNVLFQ